MRLMLLFFLCCLTMSCGGTSTPTTPKNGSTQSNTTKPGADVTKYSYEIVKVYPHDPKAFTQGLIYHDGFLYEGTGGKPARGDDFYSSVRKVDLETGKVLQKYDVPVDYFGEGITLLNDKIYEITWQERTGFVYNLSDFKLLKEFHYAGDGWGLTNDGTNLIMSDGTHVIKFVDPETFQTLRTIVVMDEQGKPLMKLNELEYIKGQIWANIWETPWIVIIDPANGKLLGRIDFSKLVDQEQDTNKRADVLNGVAYDAAGDRIFITGKNWTRLFEIKVKPK